MSMALLVSVISLTVQLLPIIIFFVAGALLRQRLLHQWQGDLVRLRGFQRALNLLLMEVLLPAIAFLSMARIPLGFGWRLGWVPVLGLMIALLALLINHLLLNWAPIRPPDDAERRALDMLAPWSNTVIIGLPTVAALLGPEQLYIPFLETSFVWTLLLGPLVIHRIMRRDVLWASLQPLLRSLWFWAIPIGLVWGIVQFPLPDVVLLILERAREAFLALGMLVVGLGFDAGKLRPSQARTLPLGAIGISGAVKLLLCPLLALVLTLPLGLPHDVPAALALTVATPSSLTAYIISEREGVDSEFMSFVFALYGTLFFATVLIVRGVLIPLFSA
jgi:predicted permease